MNLSPLVDITPLNIFFYQNVCCGCHYLTSIVYAVSANNKTRSLFLGFLVLHVAYKLFVRDVFLSVVWHVLLLDELDCVGWVFDASADVVG